MRTQMNPNTSTSQNVGYLAETHAALPDLQERALYSTIGYMSKSMFTRRAVSLSCPACETWEVLVSKTATVRLGA